MQSVAETFHSCLEEPAVDADAQSVVTEMLWDVNAMRSEISHPMVRPVTCGTDPLFNTNDNINKQLDSFDAGNQGLANRDFEQETNYFADHVFQQENDSPLQKDSKLPSTTEEIILTCPRRVQFRTSDYVLTLSVAPAFDF
jgi:hypothetical protein